MKAALAQMKIRLAPPIKAWIEEKARQNHRTQNAEIAFRLEFAKATEEMRRVAAPDDTAAGEASRA